MPPSYLKLCTSINAPSAREVTSVACELIAGTGNEQIIGAAIVAMTAERTLKLFVAGTLRHDPAKAAAGLRRLARDLEDEG